MSKQLPFCPYPTSKETHLHGQYELPAVLPIMDLQTATKYRSNLEIMNTSQINPSQVLELMEVITESFHTREPMSRHMHPPAKPAIFEDHLITDAFGTSPFGDWTSARHIYWCMRTEVFTDQTAPHPAPFNKPSFDLSIAAFSDEGKVIGGVVGEILHDHRKEWPIRKGDPILEELERCYVEIVDMIKEGGFKGIERIGKLFPEFQTALDSHRVAHLFFIARSDALSVEDTFELFASACENFKRQGMEYAWIEASNQWTGAACEMAGGVRVAFEPFQGKYSIPEYKGELVEGKSSSVNGWLSAKDSGMMFYLIKLQ